MTATAQSYLDLLPSQNRAQPNFSTMVSATVQPFVDAINVLNSVPILFDIDTAIGQQLDMIGQWVGVSRNLSTSLTGQYFSWDTPGSGWDQGVWHLPGDPLTGILILDDPYYRAVLKARILNNHWDGDITDAYALMSVVFATFGYTIGIQDFGNLTMGLVLMGPVAPDSVLNAIFLSGLLDVRPIGVQITSRVYLNAAKLDTTFILDTSQLI